MPEIENFHESAQQCFELAKCSEFLEEDIALEAFELLTANNYDHMFAYAFGVSLVKEVPRTWMGPATDRIQ